MTRWRTELTRKLLIVLITLGVAYLVVMIALLIKEPDLVFAAERSRDELDTRLDPGWRVARLQASDDVRVEAIVATPARDPRGTVLYLHGNATSIWSSQVRRKLRMYQRMGYRVVAVEYRGFGRAEGTPTEAGLIADGLAAARFAEDSLGVRAEELIVHGMSLGTGVATAIAAQRAPRLLILDGAFASLPEIAAELYPLFPFASLLKNRFDNRSRLDSVHVPVLHVHAANDEVVPYRHGAALAEDTKAPHVLLTTNGGHVAGAFADTQRFGAVLDSLLGGRPAP